MSASIFAFMALQFLPRFANGLDFLIYRFHRLRGRSARLVLASYDLVMRFLLRRRHRVFGILGASRQVGELFRELGHVYLHMRK